MRNNNLLCQCVHFSMAAMISIIAAIVYYKLNIASIDLYDQFIYGDTINSIYSKVVDYRFIPIFSVLTVVLFLVFDSIGFFQRFFKQHHAASNYLNSLYEKIEITSNDFIARVQQFHVKYTIIGRLYDLVAVLFFSYLSSILFFYIFRDVSDSLFYRSAAVISLIIISYAFQSRAVLVSQLFLSFSPLIYLRDEYIYGGEIISFEPSNSLQSLLIALTLWSFVLSVLDIVRSKGKISFAFLVFFCVVSLGAIYRIYSLDEYHLGELYTNYHQAFILELSFYESYIPTKGFMHTFVGFCNELFFDGDYITITIARTIAKLIQSVVLLSVLSVYYRKSIILILLMLGLVLDGNYFLVIIGLCLLSDKRIADDGYNFIIVALFFSFLFFLYYNAFALGFGAMLLPIVLYRAKLIFSDKIFPSITQLVLVAFGLGILIGFFDYIILSIQYVVDNASSNLFYWGNPGKLKYLIRYNAWVVLSLVFVFLVYTRNHKITKYNAVWLSFFVIFPFVILSYLEGRADGRFGRAYGFSLYVIPVLFAYLAYEYGRMSKKSFSLLSMVLLCSLTYIITPIVWRVKIVENLNKVLAIKPVNNNALLTSIGDLPNLGVGFIAKDRYSDLLSEYSLVRELADDETFLIVDPYVTQSARYSIFDKKIPTKSHSVLNISSVNAQADELAKLETMNVKIIRISSGVQRYHLLFKYLLSLDYVCTSFRGRDYLIQPAMYHSLKGDFEFGNECSLSSKYSTTDFGLLPIKWGGALDSQRNNLDPVQFDTRLVDTDFISGFVFDIVNHVHGDNIDLINLYFDMPRGQICPINFLWDDGAGFRQENSAIFKVSKDNNIVPIHMNVNWASTERVSRIRVEVDQCASESVIVRDLSGYQYNFAGSP